MEHFFPPNSGEDQKKKVFTKNETLFSTNSSEITFHFFTKNETYAQMHTRVVVTEWI